MIEDLKRWAEENGYITAEYKPDGKIVSVLMEMFNAQIVIGNEFGVDERYSYVDLNKATIGYAIWRANHFEGEPTGWIRHQPSNRRRQDGDPETEEIRP
jgi:hypothetical protein